MYSIVGWQVLAHSYPSQHHLPNKTDNRVEHNLFSLNYWWFIPVSNLWNCAPSDLHITTCWQEKKLHGKLFGIIRPSLIYVYLKQQKLKLF